MQSTKGISSQKVGKISVELWDISGDHAYSSCLPAIIKDTDGVLFVFDANGRTDELEYWHKIFVQELKLKDSCCMVFAHAKSLMGIGSGVKNKLRMC